MTAEPTNVMCNTPDVHGERCRCRLTLPEQAGSDFDMNWSSRPTPADVATSAFDETKGGVDDFMQFDAAYFCDRAREIVSPGGDRANDYGDAAIAHDRIAALWSVVLGVEVTGEQVALCMIQLKLARLFQKIDHTDSWVDIIGYAALGGQISHNR